MIAHVSPSIMRRCCFMLSLAMLCLQGCTRTDPNKVQGYVEGEFVYVSAPLPGALKSLKVQRGQQVKADERLFQLDSALEQAARNEANDRLAQARAGLEDARKGRRPSEIESLNAQLERARTALSLSGREFARLDAARESNAVTTQELDRARSLRDQDLQRVAQAQADLATAKLGARDDQVIAAEAEVRAREAALAAAEWSLSQKHQGAPQAGVVFDTLYREGEWVVAGRPVVSLLPPENIKVRAFVPEARISTIHVGDTVKVIVDGVPTPYTGSVNFISPQAEYTPPVIYSRESRSKLVFMIEIVFEPEVAPNMHPGQPVDVRFDH